MIADFKKRLFCQLSGAPLREVDANDRIWMDRINHFFSTRSVLPAPGHSAEYAEAFQAVYPSPEDRRNYIEAAIKRGTPSFAHRALAALLSTGRVPCVFTTNFDPLIEISTTITDQLLEAKERAYLTVAAIDNAERAELCVRESRWPLLAKLHGDFQSVNLKNTAEELQTQDVRMRAVFTTACAHFGLVVAGYSGRDESIMEALRDACTQPNAFPGGIYWVTSAPDSVLSAVTSFLDTADKVGITTALVESQTFDELAADIVDGIELPAPLKTHVYQARPAPLLTSVPVPTHEHRSFPVLQCSAIPILSMPALARRITVSTALTSVRARELLREANVWGIVASSGNDVAAFGRDEELIRAFAPVGGRLSGTIDLRPENDSWALGLLYDALTRAVCRNQPLFARLRRSGHLVLVAKGSAEDDARPTRARNYLISALQKAYSAALVGTVPNHGLPFNEGVQLRLENTAGRWWCVFEPVTFVQFPRREEAEADSSTEAPDEESEYIRRVNPVADWRRERWARRYNGVWAKIISAWADMLAGQDNGTVCAVGLDAKQGQDAIFRFSSVTAWSRPGNDHPYFSR